MTIQGDTEFLTKSAQVFCNYGYFHQACSVCHLGSDPSLDTLEVEILGPLNRADAARELVEKVACLRYVNISIALTLTGEWSACTSFRGDARASCFALLSSLLAKISSLIHLWEACLCLLILRDSFSFGSCRRSVGYNVDTTVCCLLLVLQLLIRIMLHCFCSSPSAIVMTKIAWYTHSPMHVICAAVQTSAENVK